MIILSVILIRLLASLLILKWPLAGVFLSVALDGLDFWIVGPAVIGEQNYQLMDKVLDTMMLTSLAIVVLGWKDKLARRVALSLYVLRLIGVGVLLLTGAEYMLFFFPNVFLYFATLYLLHQRLTGSYKLVKSKARLAGILAVLTVAALLSEFYLHVYRVVGLTPPGVIQSLYDAPYFVQAIFYLTVPLSALFLLMRGQLPGKKKR